MSFAAPWGLAALALAVPLTVWYVLRARRPRVEVASTFLWRQSERSVAAAIPWQRFRPDRTYWLVLLAIVAGAIALARPTVAAEAVLGDHTIVLLDTSASMSADENGPTRLELARRAARELAGRLGPGQTLSVIEAGPRARILLAASSDGASARRAITAAAPSGGAADYADAFTLAASLQRPGETTVTHLYTDGPVPDAAAAFAPTGLVIDGVGDDRANLGVSRLQAHAGTGGGAQAFLQVRNQGQLATDATVTVSVDAREVSRTDVSLAPRGTEDLLVDLAGVAAGDRGVVRATVAPRGADAAGAPPSDALALDDTAVAVLAGDRDVTALVVGSGNVFIASALAAVPWVEVRTADAVPGDLSAVDLLVVDRVIAPLEPTVPTLYVAPRRPPADVAVDGSLELPALTFQDADADLLADVDLAGTAIARAQRVTAPTLQTVASGPDGPLLLAGRLGGTPAIYLPFELGESNLPLQVAWPVLVANAVTYLAGPPTTPSLTAGSVAAVPVPRGAASVEVVGPGGQPTRLDLLRPQHRFDTPGLYEIRYGAADADAEIAPGLIAVNTDPAESDLARGRPEPLEAPGQRSGQPQTAQDGRRGLGPLLLTIPLAALVAEWFWRPRRRERRERGGRRRRLRRSQPA